MVRDIKLSFQIGAVFIGTVVGAGFATGQEIMQFFTVFGRAGMITLFLSGLFFYFMADAVIRFAEYNKSYNYKELVYNAAGRRTGLVYDILLTSFLFIGTSIMFAGSGALFRESLGLPGSLGIVLMAVLTLIVTLQSLTGILRINSIIVPMLFIVVGTVLSANVFNGGMEGIGSKLSGNCHGGVLKPIFFFLFYCCYNTFLSIGVLSAIPEKVKSRSALRAGILLGAMGLMVLSIMLNISLIQKSPGIFNHSIPMNFVTADFGKAIKGAVTFCIWCEIFSTAVSNTFGMVRRLSNRHMTYGRTCFAVIFCCMPLAFFEFRKLIGFFYPVFGILSMYIIFKLMLFSGKPEQKAAKLWG